MNKMAIEPLFEGIDPSSDIPKRELINVNGREEHEAWLKDPDKCRAHGLDHTYEVLIYLKRWGDWY